MLWPIIRVLQNGGKVAGEMPQGTAAAFSGWETVLHELVQKRVIFGVDFPALDGYACHQSKMSSNDRDWALGRLAEEGIQGWDLASGYGSRRCCA
jgi:hypothetical protein